jgi:hypothetical protein
LQGKEALSIFLFLCSKSIDPWDLGKALTQVLGKAGMASLSSFSLLHVASASLFVSAIYCFL